MKINAGQASSTLIPEYIGSDFDKIISVVDNMEVIKPVTENINNVVTVANNILAVDNLGTNIDDVMLVADNILNVNKVVTNLDNVTLVADNILIVNKVITNVDDVVTVADNIDYVKGVAEGIEGLPVSGYIGDTPPTQPKVGTTWYCTLDGRNYIWYADVDSAQWVESSPQNGVSTYPDKMTLNAAATDTATTTELVNQIRAGLIAIGLAQ